MKELELQFEVILKELSTSLTETEVGQMQELVRANELGVAFENFCRQLYERGAVCSQEQIIRIAAIGEAMGIEADYWRKIAIT
jgi:hypothetical protein